MNNWMRCSMVQGRQNPLVWSHTRHSSRTMLKERKLTRYFRVHLQKKQEGWKKKYNQHMDFKLSLGKAWNTCCCYFLFCYLVTFFLCLCSLFSLSFFFSLFSFLDGSSITQCKDRWCYTRCGYSWLDDEWAIKSWQ